MACGWALGSSWSSSSASATTFTSTAATQTPRLRATATEVNRLTKYPGHQRAAEGVKSEDASKSALFPSALLGCAATMCLASKARSLHRARCQSNRGGAKTTRKATITAMIEDEDLDEEDEELSGAIVKKTSVLVMGATGTLGRQVVRQLLNAGYSVRCVVRNKADRPFSFLVDWGATVVEGSLARAYTLPSALVGIHTVVDCSSAGPEESIFNIDWEGKKRFIQCCEKMKIQRYLFVSIKDCDQFSNVPLMKIKSDTEKFLKKTKMRHTILRSSSYMQPLISQYAIAILDDDKVYTDDGNATGIAYIDSTDCARMIVSACNKERTVGQTLTVTGPKVWSTDEIIKLCEEKSGREADKNVVSVSLLGLTKAAAQLFEWSIDVAERLRFSEVSSESAKGCDPVMSEDTYKLLGLESSQTRDLDTYFGEFYRRVFKKLTMKKYVPEDGELEKEKAEAEERLNAALSAGAEDRLPAGQPEEVEVTVVEQRKMSERLQQYFEDCQIEELESPKNKWFGLVPTAELWNGRSAMMGILLGLFTEWATQVSMSKQMEQLVTIFAPEGYAM
eukprot:TRINITY_DN38624_c0_g1_i1.p1 TRINITY_DN38624_c0_g1~~TRINITY_DN38624_c0_g1_i1.p1  ORF type:complete len:612 (-),score=126.04 TRINITY_DN38624_c0_g1_i1:298-1986(-)